MRKVYVEVDIRLIINADEGVDIDEVLGEMDYEFTVATEGADIVDTEIQDWNITDSK